jgi:hypothetical protein
MCDRKQRFRRLRSPSAARRKKIDRNLAASAIAEYSRPANLKCREQSLGPDSRGNAANEANHEYGHCAKA